MKSNEQIMREAGATDADLDSPVTYRQLANYLDALIKANSDLKQRVAALETTALKYFGVHQRAQSYGRGSVVTARGSAWYCTADETRAMPGESPDWQLMVKRGRDGT